MMAISKLLDRGGVRRRVRCRACRSAGLQRLRPVHQSRHVSGRNVRRHTDQRWDLRRRSTNAPTNDTCMTGGTAPARRSAASCDDDNPCTVDDTCVSGQCQGTPAKTTPLRHLGRLGMRPLHRAGDVHAQSCQAGPWPAPTCSANCTTNDICMGIVCLGTPIPPARHSTIDKCTAEFCNPATGRWNRS